jgi:ABC-type methionine transport system permease subunit
VSYTKLDVPDPIAVAVDAAGDGMLWLRPIIKLGAIFGLTSVINVLLMGQARIFYSMEEDGLLPPFFAVLHTTYRTPASTLVFVRVVGLGPTAGVLAIALTYAGMLGKVYAEILESGENHPAQTLMRNGSGRLQAFVYALLPTHAAELASYTVYRWECAVRSSVVLGFVGAGGLGQQLDNSMKMFNGGEVATLLLVFIALVALADRVSAWLRKALA